MADASDSKSDVGDYVWVQVPSPALYENQAFCLVLITRSDKPVGSRSYEIF